ncbi:MAG: hypothetical protein HYV40_05095 [Candidatus Levybacteria bacterium]|nr:hypothetical protein [Candidatus Levybacteria bacterium]
MDERKFLELLEQRADEQERLLRQMPLQRVFVTASLWLGEHPWRFLIPFALILTLFFRLILGYRYYELVLKIFGGFGFIR